MKRLDEAPPPPRAFSLPGRDLAINLAQWCRALARPPQARTPPVSTAGIFGVVITAGAIVAAMFLADVPAVEWAHHLPRGMVDIFERITDAGLSGWYLVPSGAIVLLLAALVSPGLPRFTSGVLTALAARFGFFFLAVGVPGLVTTLAKHLIGRARPYIEKAGHPFTFMPLSWNSHYASLPSGHATTVASVAFAIGALWPRMRPLMWLYALVIMFSRIVLMSHHPSDVIAGALVGTLGAAWVQRWFASRRLVFSPRDLAARPRPSLRRIRVAMKHVFSS